MSVAVLRVAASPFEGVAERTTVPVKPFTGPTVTVMLVEVPAYNTRDGWLAETVKSTTLMVKATEWDSGPLVPVTVTVYVPGDVALRVSIDAPAPATEGDAREAATPREE